ncbi:protein phosphatase 2C-like domain-containing protein 1 [Narcine bancroftii]|uniref:protein phosphatase 2C-like domain-containing protein 1 n=1 Tax=Narcine bancroftii TaxID=1343680 RepID=UPI0038314FCB
MLSCVKNGKGYRLTGNHSTSNQKEHKPILQIGGKITKNKQRGLVEGIIRSTRGLGYHGDPKLKTAIEPIPYTVTIPVDFSCQFLLASSGFWKVLNSHEVVSITLQMLSLHFGCFSTGINESYFTYHGSNINTHIERSYDEAFTLKQNKNTEVTSQELQYETIANNISERLVQTAKLAGACDNITVLILLLPGCAETFSVGPKQ